VIFLLVLMVLAAGAASIISGWSLTTGGLVIGFLVLTIILVATSRKRADRRFFRTVGAATLGASLVTVLYPIVAFALNEPLVAVDINNRCDQPFVVDNLGLDVSPGGTQTVQVPAVQVSVLIEEAKISIETGLGYRRTFDTGQPYTVDIDGQRLTPGREETIDLGSSDHHVVDVTCP